MPLYKQTMLKEIQNALSKFFTGQRIVIFIVLLILAYALMTYSQSKSFRFDGMEDGSATAVDSAAPTVVPSHPQAAAASVSNLSTVSNPSDLLPQDKNSQWATLNPSLNPNNVIIPDLLEAGYHIGLDTIGQTLRNANVQLRSDPVIPKQQVGPWNQSTIEQDLGRVPLELGAGSR
jgi:hypothetical protein